MNEQNKRMTLEQVIEVVRQRLFLTTAFATFVRLTLIVFPLAAGVIAGHQRWGGGEASWMIAAIAVLLPLALAYLWSFVQLGDRVRSALALDERAELKDRVSSACEFLSAPELDAPRELQVQDALRRAQALDARAIFPLQWPRHSQFFPLAVLLLSLSFLVPPEMGIPTAVAADDPVKQLQLEELASLDQQLAAQAPADPELESALKQLREMRERFEQGDLSERDLMLQLARLDENLRQQANELGVENLEGELNTLVPHLMSSAATMQVAAALKENKLEKAAQELQKLAQQVKEGKLSQEELRELTLNLGLCASKLGRKNSASFGGDFANARQSLEESDGEGFEGACQSIGDKLCLLQKARKMLAACKQIGNCKSGLGQCHSQMAGFKLGPKTQSKGKGGLAAGTGASGDPFGEASRLAESYRQLVRVSGQAGDGPVQSETEITEGQLSQSQIAAKELHAEFAAVAEEAIESEAIPLSHRQHVKRYFQAIRPKD